MLDTTSLLFSLNGCSWLQRWLPGIYYSFIKIKLRTAGKIWKLIKVSPNDKLKLTAQVISSVISTLDDISILSPRQTASAKSTILHQQYTYSAMNVPIE